MAIQPKHPAKPGLPPISHQGRSDQQAVDDLRHHADGRSGSINQYPRWDAGRRNLFDIRKSGYISRLAPESAHQFLLAEGRQAVPGRQADDDLMAEIRLKLAHQLADELEHEYTQWVQLNPMPPSTPHAPPPGHHRPGGSTSTGSTRGGGDGLWHLGGQHQPPPLVLPRAPGDPAVNVIKARINDLRDTRPGDAPLVGPLTLDDYPAANVENFVRDLAERILSARRLGWDAETTDQGVNGYIDRHRPDFPGLDPAIFARMVDHARRLADGQEPSDDDDEDDGQVELEDPVMLTKEAKRAVAGALRRYPSLRDRIKELEAAGPDPADIERRADELAEEVAA
jgi:hypothetical protein